MGVDWRIIMVSWLGTLALTSCAVKPSGEATKSTSDGRCDARAATADATRPDVAVDANSAEVLSIVTYDEDIKPIMDRQCMSCHGPSSRPSPAAPDLSQYQVFANTNFLLASQVVSAVLTGRMPKGKPQGTVKPDEMMKFLQWQQMGFLQNKAQAPTITRGPQTGAKAPTYNVGMIGYEPHIKQLVDTQCISCHAPGEQAPDLSSYERLTADDNRLADMMLDEIVEGDMPKLEPLPEQQVMVFKAWREQGFPRTPGAGLVDSASFSLAPSKPAAGCP